MTVASAMPNSTATRLADESMSPRANQDAMLGEWKEAFTSKTISPNGTLEPEAYFPAPRIIGQV
jgi:hypothetical protein